MYFFTLSEFSALDNRGTVSADDIPFMSAARL